MIAAVVARDGRATVHEATMPLRFRQAAFVLALLVLPSFQSSAHEVPRTLRVEMFVRPDGHVLHLLVRIPLSGLLGTGMPTEGLGYLSLADIGPSLERTARQIVEDFEVFEGDGPPGTPRIVTTRISLPFDPSFASYAQAAAHLTGPPLPLGTQVYWTQGNFDAWFDYPIRSDRSSFAVRSGLMALAPEVTTALQFVAPNRPVRSFEFLGDPGRVWLDPHWYQVVPVFGEAGFLEAIGRVDIWMFALCVLIPWRRMADVLPIAGMFAAASLTTAIVMTFGPDATGVWLPPLIDAVAAALLVYLAVENIATSGRTRRWPGTIAIGVIVGIASFLAMRPVAQFGVEYVLTSVVAFHLGITLALTAACAAVAATLGVLYRIFKAWRLRAVILSAIVAHYAWNELMRRGGLLSGLPWPLPTPQTLVTATSWMLVLVVAAGACWLLAGFRSHKGGHSGQPPLAGAEQV